MPYKLEMNWIASQSRWKRIYLGKQYYVSPRQLREHGLPADDTMSGSRISANLWWEARRLEIDKANQVFSLDTGRRLALTGSTLKGVAEMEDEQGNLYLGKRLLGVSEGARHYWQAKSEDRIAIKPAETIGVQIDNYLQHLRGQAGLDNISESSLKTVSPQLDRLKDLLGSDTPIAELDEGKITEVYQALVKLVKTSEKFGNQTAKNHYQRLKAFIRWADGENLISRIPKNLTRYTFRVDMPTPTVLEFSFIRELLKKANEKQQLIILLSCNCAFTKEPISNFNYENFDGTHYRYLREKTRRHAGARAVVFPLWPETISLLNSIKWLPCLPYSVDGVWNKFRAKVGQPKLTLGDFRSTMATALYNSEYSLYTKHFMGHIQEKDILIKHYAVASQEKLNSMAAWLRVQVLGV